MQIDQCWHRRQLQVESQLFSEEVEDSSEGASDSDGNTFLRGLKRNYHSTAQRSSIAFATMNIFKDAEAISIENCLKANNFRTTQDRLKLDYMCSELPHTHATLEERLDKLVIQDCDELGNPPSAVDDWIERMGKSDERATCDCHHIASENERPFS